jgi:hypothetical protein
VGCAPHASTTKNDLIGCNFQHWCASSRISVTSAEVVFMGRNCHIAAYRFARVDDLQAGALITTNEFDDKQKVIQR